LASNILRVTVGILTRFFNLVLLQKDQWQNDSL
jgi:hypothetical protein